MDEKQMLENGHLMKESVTIFVKEDEVGKHSGLLLF